MKNTKISDEYILFQYRLGWYHASNLISEIEIEHELLKRAYQMGYNNVLRLVVRFFA